MIVADERIKKLAKNLVNYSCAVKPGEKVLIHHTGYETTPLAKELVKEVYEAGGIPFVKFTDPYMNRAMLMECTEEQLEVMAEIDALEMSKMTCYIGVRGGENSAEHKVPGIN